MPELPDWMRANVILGTDGVDYVPVLLAADGSMYAVLQGEYEGALKTVKLDDEGRLSAFVIDSVDAWERMLSIGNAELAVRLGSPVSYEQRGRVQFLETFENGWSRWDPSVSGLAAAVALDPTCARSGGYSVKLTAGSNASHFAQIKSYHYVRKATRWGIELSFAPQFQFERIYALLDVRDGEDAWHIGIQFDDDNGKLCVYTGFEAWTAVADATALFDYPLGWNTMKVVADISTGKYIRAFFGDAEEDVSDKSLYTYGLGGVHACNLQVRFVGDDGDNDVANVDDIIITSAEPA